MTEDKTEQLDLTGRLLIAMPGMGDPRFANSLVYLCAHSETGAMGLIVNKLVPGMSFKSLLDQLEIPCQPRPGSAPLHFGGPVESSRGFVLHGTDYRSDLSTLMVNEEFAMTATLDVLEEMGQGNGPSRALMALGYAGWGPGQLEDEIAANGWLTCDASLELVFDRANDRKWEAALESIGVSALMLSATAGHA
ncbi:YqgE/AlgH family protein [Shimia biformata]|uniref:YqgE/AlgH family protein n=1 Tax=Shimia biformata TaxID=1294299 RepID=UPI0030841669